MHCNKIQDSKHNTSEVIGNSFDTMFEATTSELSTPVSDNLASFIEEISKFFSTAEVVVLTDESTFGSETRDKWQSF
jgi:hypothetical protein